MLGYKICIQCPTGNTRLLDAGDEFYSVASGHRGHLRWLGEPSVLSRSTHWSFDNDLLAILTVENIGIWLSVKLLAEAEADGWDGRWNILCRRISTPIDYSESIQGI